MAETKGHSAKPRGYSTPTLGAKPRKPEKARETATISPEQMVAEIVRVYRLNDRLAAENRVLAEKLAACESALEGIGGKHVAQEAVKRENEGEE